MPDSDPQRSLDTWLSLMEEFEAPRDYMVWSLLASVGALLGSKCKLPLGPFISIRPNLFVVLIGPAGVRKSSAIGAVRAPLEGTSLHYGPTDTGGQRHGLMAFMEGSSLAKANVTIQEKLILPQFDLRVPRKTTDMFLVSAELGRLLGSSTRDMADFFVDLWDGEDIEYQTKAGETRLHNPAVSLLGATTPSSFAAMIPDNAGGHGILSRMLFVYAEKNYKDVPITAPSTDAWQAQFDSFKEKLLGIDALATDFELSESAQKRYVELYKYRTELRDPRLAAYHQRRPTMLLKVAMSLAALRQDRVVIKADVQLAHKLLAGLEPRMYRALEYFGKSRLLSGKMLILEFMRTLGPNQAVTREELVLIAGKDLNTREADEAVTTLLSSHELVMAGPKIVLGTVTNELIPDL